MTRKFKHGHMYSMPNGRLAVFLGYSKAHCQTHGDFIWYQAHFREARQMYHPQKGYWRNMTDIYRADVEAKHAFEVPEYAMPETPANLIRELPEEEPA